MMGYSLPVTDFSFPLVQERKVGQLENSITSKLNLSIFRVNTISGAKIFAIAQHPGHQASPLDSEAFSAEQTSNYREADTLAQQWKKLVLNRDAGFSANSLTETVKPLFNALIRFGPGAIDLRNLPKNEINGVQLAVVLRATLPNKNLTPGWEDALNLAKNALFRDGIDQADALYGLI